VRASRYAHTLGSVAALLAALSGCVYPAPCAGVGVVSEVVVYFVKDGHDDLANATWELCTHSRCAKAGLRQEAITKVNVLLPDNVTPDTAPVRLRVTRRGAAAPVIDDTVEVKLSHQSDNCGGGGYSRALTYTRDTGLIAGVPKKVSAAWLQQIRSDATATPTPFRLPLIPEHPQTPSRPPPRTPGSGRQANRTQCPDANLTNDPHPSRPTANAGRVTSLESRAWMASSLMAISTQSSPWLPL
jgi:hypothetical protein